MAATTNTATEQPHENNSTAIRNLQTYLRQLSYLEPRIPLTSIDGIWSIATQRALEAFQQLYRLPVTGRADAQTWDLLYREYLRSLASRSAPGEIFSFPRTPTDYSIGLGETSDLVGILRLMLQTLGQFYDNITVLPNSNVYDVETENAVKTFQQHAGLPQTKRVDLQTWDILAREYNRIIRQNQ